MIKLKKSLDSMIQSLNDYLKKQLESLEKYLFDNSSLHKGNTRKEKVTKNRERIAKIKKENLQNFLNVILDDLNIFFILKIYIKSFTDSFFDFLEVKFNDYNSVNQPKNNRFVPKGSILKHLEAKNDKIKQINKESNKKGYTQSISFMKFCEYQFGFISIGRLYTLDKKFEDLNVQLLNVERLLIDWYSKVFDINELIKNKDEKNEYNRIKFDEHGYIKKEFVTDKKEKNDLLNLFIGEYIKREKLVIEKYVNFFKLDKNRYIERKSDSSALQKLGFEKTKLHMHERENDINPADEVNK